MKSKRKAVAERIASLENEIRRGREYLANGAHADWHGLRARFSQKLKDGKELPPHKDWVKSVFLPRREESLARAEKALERLERE